jgi:hypothetical protein
VASGLRGAGAFKMLTSSTRLDAIKAFMPVVNLFGSVTVNEEVVDGTCVS